MPKAYWSNEAEPVALHVDAYAVPEQAETREERVLEFELAVADGARPGAHEVPAHALCSVCGKEGGQCLFLRRDFKVTAIVDPEAPRRQ